MIEGNRKISLDLDSYKTLSLNERLREVSNCFLGCPYTVEPLSCFGEERFISSLDALDCVTFCENVIAIARAGESYQSELQKIRYKDGEVSWICRNHYMSDWIRENDKRGCVALVEEWSKDKIVKKLSSLENYPAHDSEIFYTKIEDASKLQDSNLGQMEMILFVSLRPELDYFHVGFLTKKDGELYLRHASKSKGAVNDELLNDFFARNEMLGFSVAKVL